MDLFTGVDGTWYRQCAWAKPGWKLDDYRNKPITNAEYCLTPSKNSCSYWHQIRYCDTDLCNEFAKGSKVNSLEHIIVSNIMMVFFYSCFFWEQDVTKDPWLTNFNSSFLFHLAWFLSSLHPSTLVKFTNHEIIFLWVNGSLNKL